MSSPTKNQLRRQLFAVRLVVTVPTAQGFITGVFKKKLQRRRFHVTVAKHHIGVALMACEDILVLFYFCQIFAHEVIKSLTITNRHHVTWFSNL